MGNKSTGALWTPEQLKAINTGPSDGYTIVSAAAGSGKTSVLVERLLRLMSEKPGVPAETIIMATFTNDAAAGMKQRLMAGLAELLEEHPDDLWLLEQQSALQLAKISTIHSFCFDLIRENIQSLEISSGFRIMDAAEEQLLLKESLQKAIEEGYSQIPEGMELLIESFCTRDDTALETIVLELYNFLLSIPFKNHWLEIRRRKLAEGDSESWENLYLLWAKNQWLDWAVEMEECAHMAEDIPGAENALQLLLKEADVFYEAAKKLESEELSLEEKLCAIRPPVYGRLTFPKMEKSSEESLVAEEIKKRRNSLKAKQKRWSEQSSFTMENLEGDLARQGELLGILTWLIESLERELWSKKLEKNAIGFSDAEHLTIGLLAHLDPESMEISPTPLALELRDYYSVIMIDEFQDANSAQDLIFRMLSKDGDNLFVVGDVKQSIYRFRAANPGIFIRSLKTAAPLNRAILLNQNFRSRPPVVDTVNFIFGRLMSEGVGEMDYTQSECLIQGADFPTAPGADYAAEILLIEEESSLDDLSETEEEAVEGEEEGGLEDEASLTREAKTVALKINEMLEEGFPVKDKEGFRPCTPKDFCILVRNRISSEMYAKALELHGVKAHTDEVSGYLKSREISVLLNLLRVIDNPLKDIPLASVLMSPLFMLTADEVAAIRLFSGAEKPEPPLYKGVCSALKKPFFGGESSETAEEFPLQEGCMEKLVRFDRMLEHFRMLSAGYPLEKLIRTIYDHSDFLSVVQVYKDGLQKQANLRLLLEYARSYEASGDGGVSGFVRYIDRLSSQGGDLNRAAIAAASEDAVSVKTIHKSKGLEYPFIFLCRTCCQFNRRDLSKAMQTHLEEGIGFRLQEKSRYIRYPTLPYLAIRSKNQSELLSEELRLLYVALTRAKEKLFIPITLSKSTPNPAALQSFSIPAPIVSKGRSMQDWLVTALMAHPNFLDYLSIKTPPPAPSYGWPVPQLKICPPVDFSKTPEKNAVSEEAYREKLPPADLTPHLNALKDQADFQYKRDLSDIPAKLTVSEVVQGAGDPLMKRPRFLIGKGLTGAEKGLATHTFMQLAVLNQAAKSPENELKRLVESGQLTKEEAGGVQMRLLKKFFASEVYKRIAASKRVIKEKKFLVAISDLNLDDSLGQRYGHTEGVLQGIADCLFEEEDGLVVLDYKTDYVSEEGQLVEDYGRQLELYRHALSLLLNKPVKETGIYSFHLSRYIRTF